MFLQAEAGTERWVQWARRRAGTLDADRRARDLPALAKSYTPEDGTLVWIKVTDFGASIRISGAAGDVRMWDPTPASTLSVHTRGDRVVEHLHHEPADWSKGFGTLTYWNGSAVVAVRDEVDYVIPGSKQLPNHEATTFYRNTTSTMNAAGTTVVTDVAVPTAASIAKVARWDEDAGWSTTDVPFPPAISLADATIAGATIAATPEVDADATYWQATRLTADNNPYNGAAHSVGSYLAWRVMADPWHGDAVYVDVRSDSMAVGFTYTTVGITLRQFVNSIIQQVWRYDVATGAWSLAYQHTDQGTEAAQSGFLSEHGDVTNGFSYGTGFVPQVRDLSRYIPVFTPAGLSIVSFDNRVLPQPTSLDHTFDPDGLAPQVKRAACTRTAAADVLLDATPWITSASLDTASVAAGLTVLQVGTSRGGAVKTLVGATTTTYWRHEDGQSSYTGTDTRLFSRAGRWMYSGASAVAVKSAYRNGVLQYTLPGGGDTVYLASATDDARLLGLVTPPIELIPVQGGVLTVTVLGAIALPTAGPPFTNGISLDGTTLYFFGSAFRVGDLISGLTILSLAGNGSFYDLTLTRPQVFGTYRMAGSVDDGFMPALVKTVDTRYTVETVSYLFDNAKVVPDEFVVG